MFRRCKYEYPKNIIRFTEKLYHIKQTVRKRQNIKFVLRILDYDFDWLFSKRSLTTYNYIIEIDDNNIISSCKRRLMKEAKEEPSSEDKVYDKAYKHFQDKGMTLFKTYGLWFIVPFGCSNKHRKQLSSKELRKHGLKNEILSADQIEAIRTQKEIEKKINEQVRKMGQLPEV